LASALRGYHRGMPELPDVEGFRRYFQRYAVGQRVDRVEVRDRSMLRNSSPQAVGRALRGRPLERPRRHGKWLIAPAAGPLLLMHFGMTGRLAWSGGGAGPHRHDRIVLRLDTGVLGYRNMRKFGGVWLARDESEVEAVTGPLGPDAMEVDRERLGSLLAGRRGGIKAALMDQRLLAGVGNLLADEVLWRARIHPRRYASDLSRRQLETLAETMHDTIRDANRHGRIPRLEGWLTGVRDDLGPCPRHGVRLQRATVAGRTTVWCPRCQRSA
jgi:formamidopyrimidine-DNA glycosylase